MTPPATGSWKSLQETLKPEISGDRRPFFPLSQVPSGTTVKVAIDGPCETEAMHGSYSLFEMDVLVSEASGRKPYRLCVSGQRLARAIAAIAPVPGEVIHMTPTGDGKNRTWVVATKDRTAVESGD